MKNRIRRGDSEKRRYWEGMVRRWRGSGRSVAAFCRGEGLRDSAFYWWRRRLASRSDCGGKRGSGSGKGARADARSVTPASRRPRKGATPPFLPVHVVTPTGGRLGGAGAAQGVEIVLRQGRTVRVVAGFDGQTLAEVLAVLEAAPC
jgi:hypothetical protein